MKIVLVAQRDELREHIRDHFNPQGSEIIQYWNPIKAMDNIDEIEPDLVLFSALDFPRHWKPFLVYLRNSRDRDSTVFVLLKGDNFPFEEASKAHHLGANGIVHEDLENKREISRLKELVSRYKDILEARRERRYIPTAVDRIGFLFSHPETLRMITGTVEDISAGGLRLLPDFPEYAADLTPGTVLPGCSLRAGESLYAVDALVIRNDHSLHIFFKSLTDADRSVISRYLSDHVARELNDAAHSRAARVET
ncbi:PilZ domain-containing protein [Salinispira pacifica]